MPGAAVARRVSINGGCVMSRQTMPIGQPGRRSGYWLVGQYPTGPELWDNLPFEVRKEKLSLWIEFYFMFIKREAFGDDIDECLAHAASNLARLTMQPSARDEFHPWGCSKVAFVELGLNEKMHVVQSALDTHFSTQKLLDGDRTFGEIPPATREFIQKQKNATADFLDSLTFLAMGETSRLVEEIIQNAAEGKQIDLLEEGR